jgi:signal transduction histidine kinase
VKRPTEVVKIVVADSGPGVPPELAERIFDPYFTTKEPGRGTGLGLAIVARIVDGLGGTIWVSPAREGGAAFHLLFPLIAGTDGGVAGMPAVTLGSVGVPTLSGR